MVMTFFPFFLYNNKRKRKQKHLDHRSLYNVFIGKKKSLKRDIKIQVKRGKKRQTWLKNTNKNEQGKSQNTSKNKKKQVSVNGAQPYP